ncbi:unnamed protein product [Blepharisma stoltei]|uniref:Uncharacterized protein n=1 Tax=Blepharisma stoltei TaxID=1481888 RepID=A0AAU9ICB3_9CILI|nr:unnamed protein product [Blepharisma stoltei]CAG9319403.1 unnamed protein product [Blepharisma stoltei]
MSPSANESEEMIVGISNLISNSTTGLWEDFPVGSYSIVRNPVLTFDQNIIWPDGGTQPSTDIRINWLNCPFSYRQIQDSDKGEAIYYSIIAFWTALGLATSLIYISKYWSLSFPIIQDKREIKFRDWLAVFSLLIETLQLLALSPEFIHSKISNGFDYISGNLANTTTYYSKIFWPGIYTALIVCLVMLIFNLLLIFKIEEKSRLSFLVVACGIAKELLPHISNLFFISVINSLFSLFRCTKGTSLNVLDSFLYGDCNYFCWKDLHLLFAVLALISLPFFIPSAILWRPYYESLSSDKNIYCNEHYLIAKSIIQIVAITLKSTIGNYSNSLYSLLYIFCLTLFLAYSIFYKPYNYNRMNLWALLSILAVMWSSILSSIYSLANSSIFIWVHLLSFGWLCLAVFGYAFQERFYPNFLYSVQGKDISLFFRFEFSTKIKPDEVSEAVKNKYSVIDSSSRFDSANKDLSFIS